MQFFWGCRDSGDEQVHERYLCWRCVFARFGCPWFEQWLELFCSCLQLLSFPVLSEGDTGFSNVSQIACNPRSGVCNALPVSIYRMGMESSHCILQHGRRLRWTVCIYLQAGLSETNLAEIPTEVFVPHTSFMGQSLSWSCKRGVKKEVDGESRKEIACMINTHHILMYFQPLCKDTPGT
jgi:hypothetical protein